MPALDPRLITSLIPASCRKIFIAYSGGVDSHVLLHWCAAQPGLRDKIIAVYVDHGLQAVSGEWGEHCRRQAENLGVGLQMLGANARAASGESPEAAAREARYRALRELLETDDVMLLAQHREDQMETLMLQLFRGAGVAGLAGMPVSSAFGKGLMLRPLLDVAKADIQAYAKVHDLDWVEDPTNQSSDFDRNYLRNQVLPLIKQRWPALDKTVARSARLCGDAAQMIDTWAEQTLRTVFDPIDGSFSIADLPHITDVQRNCLLRQWLRQMGLKPPSRAVLQTLVDQLIGGRADAMPKIHIGGYQIRKYRQKLYCVPEQQLRKEVGERTWEQQQQQIVLSNGYVVNKIASSSGIAQGLWNTSVVTVMPRQGGETLKLPGRAGRHCLKKLYQEAGIPPWQRDVRPLICLDGRLAAIAGLWIAEWAWHSQPDGCYALQWKPLESP